VADDYLVSGIQQIGIGVASLDDSFRWYRRSFGVDVPVFDDAGEAPFMARYTGGTVQSRRAVLAMNLQGGSGFEIWQYTSRRPSPLEGGARIGDAGILATRIKARDVRAAWRFLKELDGATVTEVVSDPIGSLHFFVRDPWGNIFDVVEGQDWFAKGAHATGGPCGCAIGTSDADRVARLYRGVLGYDAVIYDREGTFADLETLPGGGRRVRRVLLGHSAQRSGAFSGWLGASRLELIQPLGGGTRRVFDGRYWGDVGFIHLCFDVTGMDSLRDVCAAAGFPFTVDSASSFDMGEAAGRFAYIEDPDGMLIEFVETHRVPIAKKWGLFLDLRRRDARRRLPALLLRALGLNRIRD
jgi:catechol 2,3-dioxygenase-like lactoylglutathione lyase family enzyme